MTTLFAVSNLKLGKNAEGVTVRFAPGDVVEGLEASVAKELLALGSISTRNPLADNPEAVSVGQYELEAAKARIAELEAALAKPAAPSKEQ